MPGYQSTQFGGTHIATMGFTAGSDDKESACSAGDPKDPLEKGMATHSSILIWRIPWTEQPGRPPVHGGHKESEMTE